MQVREKALQTLTEPVTASEFKTYIGYSGSDQDSLLATMIKSARLFLESECGFSCISKVYQAEFEKSDAVDGWYKLPFYPVTLITSVEIGDTAVGYEEKGLKVKEIKPDVLFQTIPILGTGLNILQVEFTAGESSDLAKMAIYRIVADLFNYKEDFVSGVNIAYLSFDTMRLVNSLNTNTSI